MKRYNNICLCLCGYLFLPLLAFSTSACRQLGPGDTGFAKLVPVTVDFNVNPQMNGTLSETKGSVPESEVTVDNLWVVQFDGTESNAVPALEPQYISDYSPNSLLYFSPLQKQCTVFFLANTFDNSLLSDVSDMTLSEFLNLSYQIESEEDIFQNEMTPVLSGSMNVFVKETANSLGECQLSRNYAKMKFVIINKANSLTFTGLEVENVPVEIAYSCSSSASEAYSGEVVRYEIEPTVQSSDTIEYDFCVPPNEQGTVDGSNELTKNTKAPEKALNVKLYALSSSGRELTYTFYLGSNLSDNYDILPNYYYEYDVTFNSEGNPSTDSRIWKMKTSSNCFLSKTDTPISVKLGKVDEFWGDNGYENVPEYTLGTDKQWTANVLWADMPLDNIVLTKSSGTGSSDFFTCKSSSEGNAVVAVKVNGTIVWSYHLWFCNEDLDSKAVEWQGCIFMDRNIGAKTTEISSSNLYYEFGRKDPFPLGYEIYGQQITTADGNTPGWTQNTGNNVAFSIQNPSMYLPHQGSIFYTWTSGDSYNPVEMVKKIWCDPKSVDNGVVADGYKSIFDPCPEGWKIPEEPGFTSIPRTTQYDSKRHGRIMTEGLFFPLLGYYDNFSREIEEFGEKGIYWLSSSNSYDNGYNLYMSNTSCYSYYKIKSCCAPVRCVKE